MIEYAARRGYRIWVITTLAGITRDDITRLSKLKYYGFEIHIPSDEKLMNLVINDEYLSLLADLVGAGIITNLHFHGNVVHPAVGAWLRRHDVDIEKHRIHDRAENLTLKRRKQGRRDKSKKPRDQTASSVATAFIRMYCCRMATWCCVAWIGRPSTCSVI